jgi:hypothetical protein
MPCEISLGRIVQGKCLTDGYHSLIEWSAPSSSRRFLLAVYEKRAAVQKQAA